MTIQNLSIALLKRKESLLIGSFYFFYFALVGVYIIFLPKMLEASGHDASDIGTIFAIAPLMRFALPFYFRRYGKLDRRTYTGSLGAAFLSASMFYFFMDSFWPLLLINALYGGAMGVVLPYVDTLALRSISKERYGRVRLWGSVGFMVAALWLGKVLETPEEAAIYLAVLAGATLVAGAGVKEKEAVAKENDERNKETKKHLSLSRYWAFWLSAFLLQMSFGGFYNFFTIYETSHGISLQMTSWLWSFGVLCEIAMLYFQGPLMKRDLLSLIEFATFTAVLRWLMLHLWPDSLLAAFASQSLHAINFALYYTAAIAYVYTLYSQKKLAQQFFLGITFGLGGSTGAVVSGWIYENFPDALFLGQSVIATAAFVVINIHKNRKARLVQNH